jgi:uncharacterized membrane protein YbhN (UPF0104 family)
MTSVEPRHDQQSEEQPITDAMPEQLNSGHLLRRLLGLAVFAVIVALVIAKLPGLGTLRHRFAGADWWLLAVIALCKLGSCLSNVVAFRDVFCPRMGWRFTYRLSMAEQGTNVLVPTGGAGGLALGVWALRQGGMSTEHIGRRSVCFFVLTSIPNFAVAALLGPLLMLGVLPGKAPLVPTLAFTVLAWLAILVAASLPHVLTRIDPDGGTHAFSRRVRGAAVILGRGIADTGRLLRQLQWRAILGAFGYLLFDIAAMVIAFAAFGHVGFIAPLMFAYVVGQLGGLIPLPAGIGGIDGGLIGALILYGAASSQAAAADFAYRTFQLGVPAILGTIAFILLRRMLSRSNAPAVECAQLAEQQDSIFAAHTKETSL